ncbi:MAG: hypothetical protein ACP5E4_00505, partial [Candidatus Aenigmatarchaeota archaeon]
FSLYGAKALAVLSLVDESPDLAQPLVSYRPDIRAQVVYAVDHRDFQKLDVAGLLSEKGIFVDIRRRFKKGEIEGKGFIYWGL